MDHGDDHPGGSAENTREGAATEPPRPVGLSAWADTSCAAPPVRSCPVLRSNVSRDAFCAHLLGPRLPCASFMRCWPGSSASPALTVPLWRTLIAGLVFALSTGCSPRDRRPAVIVAALVLDVSASGAGRETTVVGLRCGEAEAVLQRVLAEAGGASVEAFVFATGGENAEPEVFAWTSPPRGGFLGDPHRQRREDDGSLHAFARRCGELHEQRRTALHRALYRTSQTILSACAEHERRGRRCFPSVFVFSDGQENDEPHIRRALKEPTPAQLERLETLVLSFPGSRISWCGLASPSAARLPSASVTTVWNRILGQHAPAEYAAACPLRR